MAAQAQLQAEHRTITGKAVRHLRRQGIIPANLTGNHMDPLVIQVKTIDIDRLLKAHGRTTVIRLSIAQGAQQTVMVGHVQREPVSRAIHHIDFLLVDMTEKMRANVPLHPTGEAPAVTSHAGILLQLLTQIEVEALPDDLPAAITVDLSGLVSVDDTVYVRDLTMPAAVTLLAAPDEPVVKIVQTRASVEAAPEATETAPATTPTESPGA
jgi:large subunit ribosomal protein L25